MSKELTKTEYKFLSKKLSKLKQQQQELEKVLEPQIIKVNDKKNYLTTLYQAVSLLYSVKGDHNKLINSLKEMADSIERGGRD